MRKSVSLIFLVLFLANIIGYYGLLMIAKKQIENRIVQGIERNADEITGNLIVRIPLTLPYPIANSGDFVRIKGELTYGNARYRMIKQRVYMDTLQVVCIRVRKMEVIHDAIADYVKSFSDSPQQTKSGLKITSIKNCLLSKFSIPADTFAWHRDLPVNQYINHYSFAFSNRHLRPPDYPC
jgi:hypothetical protein